MAMSSIYVQDVQKICPASHAVQYLPQSIAKGGLGCSVDCGA